MATQNSGVPEVREYAVTITAQTVAPPTSNSKYLQLYNEGANPVRVFFDPADVGTNARALTLAANGSAGDFFDGPVFTSRLTGIALQTTTSTSTVRAVWFQESVV